MKINFSLLCAVLMIPMIFFVPIIYTQAFPSRHTEKHLVEMIIALLTGILCWIFFGYFESFQVGSGNALPIISQTFSPVMFVQLDFFLYALVMFTGTAITKHSWNFFLIFVPVWTLLVYAPIANMMWSKTGYLAQLGALDFSGGLVVHLTAGLTSLMIAFSIRRPPNDERSTNPTLEYIAILFVITGWFGFNLAPAGSFQNYGNLIVTNTLIAIIAATFGWLIPLADHDQPIKLNDVVNGILVGLVTSTAAVGYVSPLSIGIITLLSGLICHLATDLMNRTNRFYDAVDSFTINGVGGLIGTLGLIFLADTKVNPSGANGLLYGDFHFAKIELIAIVIISVMTILGAALSLLATNILSLRKD
ncbi:ammonium transporter [Lentilactobacillus fungorum]|uniref:Ammonium transporter n=1 Tax=Lentilactobacillus fungorum TaxID=2201250 RepID=A0ABQ3VZD6_9LACO|nr:ammonium transporter [Lentilactobacillus fungorum]GHP13778.1 ammonium transporter [Lentilactobacillus fungorum]